jgi:hypothetical protein
MSRLSAFQYCERSFGFKYLYKIEPPKLSPWMVLGRAFAACRGKIDAGLPWAVPVNVAEPADRLRLETVLEEYAKRPKLASWNEVKCETRIGDVVLLGYLDGLSVDETRIYEWKYTVDPDSFTRLKITPQAVSYLAGTPKATEFVLCTARRPKQEPYKATAMEERKYTQEKTKKCIACGGVPSNEPLLACKVCAGTGRVVTEPARLYKDQREFDETPDDFKKRLVVSLGPTGSFFAMKTYLRDEFDIDGELKNMQSLHHDSLKALELRRFRPNYSKCDGCGFEPYCATHVTIGCTSEACSHPNLCAIVRGKENR